MSTSASEQLTKTPLHNNINLMVENDTFLPFLLFTPRGCGNIF